MLAKLKNLFSRKFLVTVVGNIVSIAIIIGGDDNLIKLIGCGIMALVDVIYIVMEALIDKKSVSSGTEIDTDELVNKIVAAITTDVDTVSDAATSASKDAVAAGVETAISTITTALNVLKEINEDSSTNTDTAASTATADTATDTTTDTAITA